jgi:hypothetical protein
MSMNAVRVDWFARDPGGSTTYISPYKECEFCTREVALACKDPVCRAAGYGELTSNGADPGGSGG